MQETRNGRKKIHRLWRDHRSVIRGPYVVRRDDLFQYIIIQIASYKPWVKVIH